MLRHSMGVSKPTRDNLPSREDKVASILHNIKSFWKALVRMRTIQ